MKQALDIEHRHLFFQSAGIQIFDDPFRFFQSVVTDQYPQFQNIVAQIIAVHLDGPADGVVGVKVEKGVRQQVVSVRRIRFLFHQSLGTLLRFLIIFPHQVHLGHGGQDLGLVFGDFQRLFIGLCHPVFVFQHVIEVGHSAVHFAFSLLAGNVLFTVLRQFVDRFDQFLQGFYPFLVVFGTVGQCRQKIIVIKGRRAVLVDRLKDFRRFFVSFVFQIGPAQVDLGLFIVRIFLEDLDLVFDDERIHLLSSFVEIVQHPAVPFGHGHHRVDLLHGVVVFLLRFQNVCVETAQSNDILVLFHLLFAQFFRFLIISGNIVFPSQHQSEIEIVFIFLGQFFQIRDVFRIHETGLPAVDQGIPVRMGLAQSFQCFDLIRAVLVQSGIQVGIQVLLAFLSVFSRNEKLHRQDVRIKDAVDDDPVDKLAGITLIEFFLSLHERKVSVHAQPYVVSDRIMIHQIMQEFFFDLHVSRDVLTDLL